MTTTQEVRATVKAWSKESDSTRGQESIGHGEDIIDTRDIGARLRWLYANGFKKDEETQALEKLLADCAMNVYKGALDENDCVILVRDSYFEEHARDEAESMGAIDPKANWPLRHIDWSAAADELKMDYMEIDFYGVTYWARG